MINSTASWRPYAAAGASVEMLEPVDGLPDLVFTANAGIVDGQRFVTEPVPSPREARGDPRTTNSGSPRGALRS